MKKKRRTRTTIEKREVVIIRGARKLAKPRCPDCAEMVALVTLGEAVNLSGITPREIFRWIEAGDIHFFEKADGLTLICPTSLLRQVWKKQG